MMAGFMGTIEAQARPKNKSEGLFFDEATSKEWVITKKGWPDFACFLPNGDFILVEVKGSRTHRLRAWQWQIIAKLSQAGIRCYRWDPKNGFATIGMQEDPEAGGSLYLNAKGTVQEIKRAMNRAKWLADRQAEKDAKQKVMEAATDAKQKMLARDRYGLGNKSPS